MPPSRSKQGQWLLGIVLFVLSCVVYLPVLHAGFIWDDVVMVTDNQSLRDFHGLRDIWFSTKTTDVYPITFSMLWLEWHLWGANPIGYHVVNVILHAIGAVLLWRLLKRLALPGAWFGAALFALHPVSVASVAWISERKNTLSILFFLLTLISYLRFQSSSGKKWYALALAAFVGALLSKTSVVMLPFVLLLIVWWQTGALTRKDILRAIPFFSLSFVFGLVTIWNQHYHAIGDSVPQQQNLIEKIAGAGCAVLFYLWKDFLPVNLSVIYPQWELRAGNVLIYLPFVALSGILLIAWTKRKTWGRHVLFGFGYFVLMLFPVMGFFDMYFLTFSRVADHLQYLALAGIVPCFVCCFCAITKRAKLSTSIALTSGIVVIAVFAVATWIRAGVYKSEETVWSDTVKKNPRAWMAYNNLGNTLFAQKRLDEARSAYESALRINSEFPDAHSNLGNLLVEKRELDNAVQHLLKATQVQTNNPKFHFNLGVALAEQNKYDEALKSYATALRFRPRYSEVHNNIANVLLKQNKSSEALEHASIAIQLNPNSMEAHYNAAEAFSNLGKKAEAVAEFQAALSLRPDSASAHYNLALLLAMNNEVEKALPHFREVVRLKPNDSVVRMGLGNALAVLKHLDEGISEFQMALRLDPNNAEAHNNLATALSEKGRLPEACEHYAASLKLDPQNVNAYLNFGVILERLGKRDEALTQYQAALRLKPGDETVQRQIRAMANGSSPTR
ncbi:MAG: Tetratricopeptide 2 repeat protein [Verrucomicrobiales bacterium]|nr:Tetratricopeptide 2 repeat protein [Verrucomicrobiales bacterium]